jgi:hypothetical protein
MHDRPHLPMSPAEAASLRASSPVDEALLQRIRAALVAGAPSDPTPSGEASTPAESPDPAAADGSAAAEGPADGNAAVPK